MKKVLLLIPALLLLLASGNLWAQQSSLIPVKIYINSHQDVYKFQDLGVGIEELREGYIEARVTKAKIDELISLGWKVETRLEEKTDPKIVTQYHDYAQMTIFLDSIHTIYPAITKKVSIGQSVEGRELWAFLVTDNPDSAENEAEVRLAATIHGNEPVGTELCIAMIDSLTQSYDSIPGIRDLVDSREIWFMPMLNPDGNALGNVPNARYNANGVDLNRNFPVPNGATPTAQPETKAMMDWCLSKRFVLGCMYHEGAQVVNYQWDYSGTPAPDNDLIRQVSLGYSRLNARLYNELWPNYPNTATVIDSGVVFGYYWYQIFGSLQDWSYYANSCVDLTIEIDTIQFPPDSVLSQRWIENRNSILFFIRQAGLGIQGLVTDSATGQPLDFVQIDVAGINKPVYTDTIGDYHRMLLSGTYDFTFSKGGYFPKTISGVRVNYDSLTNLDVALAKDPGGVAGKPSEIIQQKGLILSNRPNPFGNQTTINYQISKSGMVSLKIYNAAGQLVKTLANATQPAGHYAVNWDGRDESGKNVSNGVYIYRLQAGDISQIRKMIVLR